MRRSFSRRQSSKKPRLVKPRATLVAPGGQEVRFDTLAPPARVSIAMPMREANLLANGNEDI